MDSQGPDRHEPRRRDAANPASEPSQMSADAPPPVTAPSAVAPESILNARLTEPQREAVRTLDGAMLVLAGPGSGKTRTVTHRIAYMLEQGIKPWRILAITFTNKAAREMADRVEQLAPGSEVWNISTFHKFCARLLRRRAGVVGLESNYSIIDTRDQRRLLSEILSDLDFDASHYSPDKVAGAISQAKNDLLTPERYVAKYTQSVADHWQAIVAKVYPAYQKRMLEANSVDFDDLLLHTAIMLEENDELRDELGSRHQYIMVDEYQDTNMTQYRIVAALAEKHRNLCVTGDPDQSIYGWRGAKIANILNFERDFPEAKTVRLEQNFRSTKAVLEVADRLIGFNRQRKAKTLTTENPDGEGVRLLKFDDGIAEADHIASQIAEAVRGGDRTYDQFAIFYRVNSLSRQLESALARQQIPYQVAKGTAFYDRAEVKDVVAYLRLVANPADRQAFLRIINKPARRLGQTSQKRLVAWADENGETLIEAASHAGDCPALGKPAARGFRVFAETLRAITLEDCGTVAKLVRAVVERTGYLVPYRDESDEKSVEVVTNVEEVITAAAMYDRRAGEEATLEGFLEESALVSDTDALDADLGQVTMMTLHAAKGLEYPVVFLVGVEQGLIPHDRSLRENDPAELEEERRLLFVGITRAEEELTLSQTAARVVRGRSQITISSQFLPELGLENEDLTTKTAGSATWYEQHEGWDEPVIDVSEGSEPAGEGEEVELPFEPAEGPKKPQRKRHAPKPGATPFSELKLTTGAAMLGGGEPVSIPHAATFQPGMTVRHPHYGRGTVVRLGGVGRRKTVEVEFDEGRVEKFIAGLAPLQPVGVG